MADTVSIESDCKVAKQDKVSSKPDAVVSKQTALQAGGFRFIDVLFALVLSIPAFSILIVCYFLMKFLNGWQESFLIRSHRVGVSGKSFSKLKIRTTRFIKVEGTEESRFENLRLGALIRSTRLDALPQIWNVFWGDMAWIGPRAPRKMISYSLQSFGIHSKSPLIHKPGLMRVYSVASSIEQYPRIAWFFEKKASKVQNNFFLYTGMVAFRGVVFGLRLMRKLIAYVFRRLFQSARGGNRRRIARITKPIDVEFFLYNSSMDKKILNRALVPGDINYEAISFNMPELLDEERQVGIEWVYEKSNFFGRKKRKTIRGLGYLQRKQADKNSDNVKYVLFYRTISPLNRYLMDFYILKDSLR